jgi:DNA invertase Pin-like site-specific DNA recombinase
MPATIGYARTSTADQIAGLEAQIRDLLAAGCEREHIFSEQVSSVAEREQLDRALAAVGSGDTLVVTKPDRLARSTLDLLTIEADLTKRGVGLLILSMGGERLDTRNPTSRLMLTILGGVATWEREIMLERQREGIAKAQLAGRYKGRKPTAPCAVDSVIQSHLAGTAAPDIAIACGVSLRSVWRIVKAHKPAQTGHNSQDRDTGGDISEPGQDIAA